jgi:formate dehydrogenase maturation protein FdhE
MQTNILGPKDAPYVITLTDLEELTKKERAILLACVQNYYEESIHRLALALREPHGEDELAFLACILTQFYHKAGIELPNMLLMVANMEIQIVDETTNLVVLFLMQIDRGFRGVEMDNISDVVRIAAEKRTSEVTNKIEDLSSNDREHIQLAILADELSNHTFFNMALIVYKMAAEAKSTHQFMDFEKWQNAKVFGEAYNVGSLINAVNNTLPESESNLLNQMHEVIPFFQLELKRKRRKEKEEMLRQEKKDFKG